jgi:hypothetical protein
MWFYINLVVSFILIYCYQLKLFHLRDLLERAIFLSAYGLYPRMK